MAPGVYVCSVCGTEVVSVVPSWKDHSKATRALFGLETWAENSQVHGSPSFCEALRGPINCGQQVDTVNATVSVGLHGNDTPGMIAVTLTL
jgi:hypothetical protein